MQDFDVNEDIDANDTLHYRCRSHKGRDQKPTNGHRSPTPPSRWPTRRVSCRHVRTSKGVLMVYRRRIARAVDRHPRDVLIACWPISSADATPAILDPWHLLPSILLIEVLRRGIVPLDDTTTLLPLFPRQHRGSPRAHNRNLKHTCNQQYYNS